jgi:hypothetical protein
MQTLPAVVSLSLSIITVAAVRCRVCTLIPVSLLLGQQLPACSYIHTYVCYYVVSEAGSMQVSSAQVRPKSVGASWAQTHLHMQAGVQHAINLLIKARIYVMQPTARSHCLCAARQKLWPVAKRPARTCQRPDAVASGSRHGYRYVRPQTGQSP